MILNLKLEDTKRNSDKLIDTLKAVLEETDIRIADLKKEAYEFKRDIVVGAENMRTGNTMAEKVGRESPTNNTRICATSIRDILRSLSPPPHSVSMYCLYVVCCCGVLYQACSPHVVYSSIPRFRIL